MLSRIELTQYLANYLQVFQYKDYAPNGLQVEGKPEIKRIRTAVTASYEVIQAAIEAKADALLVHHGYFWKGEAAEVTGMKKQRLSALLLHDLNLFAYHLPLDCHPDLGNNVCFARRLSLSDVKSHTAQGVPNLLWTGALDKAYTEESFESKLAQIFNRKPQYIAGSKRSIETIAFCTGSAQDFIEQAASLGVDAYISGEISERTYYQAKELGIHYFACGHHATERDGIRALGEHLALTFGLEHAFIDSDNPV